MLRLEVLVGPIASGKSTYALRRAKEGALVVSHDALTEMLHGEYRYEQGLRDCYRRMEEWLAFVALTSGRDVVVDRTHLTRESRARWLRFNRDHVDQFEGGPIVTVAVLFPIGDAATHARRRSDHDPRGRDYYEWLEVAEHHARQAAAEPFADDEGFDRVYAATEADRGVSRAGA